MEGSSDPDDFLAMDFDTDFGAFLSAYVSQLSQHPPAEGVTCSDAGTAHPTFQPTAGPASPFGVSATMQEKPFMVPEAGITVTTGSDRSLSGGSTSLPYQFCAGLQAPQPATPVVPPPASGEGTSDWKSQRIAEKNRKAQRRFRERQKSRMNSLELTVQELHEEIKKIQEEKEGLINQNAVLRKVLEMRESQIRILESQNSSSSQEQGAEDSSSSSATGKWEAKGSSSRYTAEQIKSMTNNELVQTWKAYVRDVSRLLVHAEGVDPPKDAIARVEALVAEAGDLCTRVAVLMPMTIGHLVRCNLDTGELGSVSEFRGLHRYIDIVPILQLSDAQKDQIIRLRKEFFVNVEASQQERVKINAELTQHLPDTMGGEKCLATELMEELKLNMREEHSIFLGLIVPIFQSVLSLLQLAHLSVQSYPYFPDALGLANAIAEHMGVNDPIAQHLPKCFMPGTTASP